MNKKHLLLSTALTSTLAFTAGAWAEPPIPYVKIVPAYVYNWDVVVGPSFSDGHVRGTLAGGFTFQRSTDRGVDWGFHGELGVTYGENRWDETDHDFAGQGVAYLRDPMTGEIGFYGGFVDFSDVLRDDRMSYGLEGEYYMPRVTLGGAIGIQHVKEDHLVSQLGVSVYMTDNFKLSMSGVYEEGDYGAASFGLEYRPSNDGFLKIGGTDTTLFLNTTFSHEVAAVRGGIRWSWGNSGNNSLLYSDRHERKNFFGSMLGSSGISPFDDEPYK